MLIRDRPRSNALSPLILFSNPIHYTTIADFAETHCIDVFTHTETWISPNATSAQLFDAIPRSSPSFTPRRVLDSFIPECPGHDVKLHPHFHCHW